LKRPRFNRVILEPEPPHALVVIRFPQIFLATPYASPGRSQVYTTGKLSLAIPATMSYSSPCRFYVSLQTPPFRRPYIVATKETLHVCLDRCLQQHLVLKPAGRLAHGIFDYIYQQRYRLRLRHQRARLVVSRLTEISFQTTCCLRHIMVPSFWKLPSDASRMAQAENDCDWSEFLNILHRSFLLCPRLRNKTHNVGIDGLQIS
jgi:hypothetical protein